MAVESKNGSQEGKTYLHKRCLSCRVKVHVGLTACWKCGKKIEDMTYGSDNPKDAIYNRMMNWSDTCIECPVTQREKTCGYKPCFGLGKGQCDICRQFNSILFDCCQIFQNKEKKWVQEHADLMNRCKTLFEVAV